MRLTWPNLLTALRIALIPFFIILMIEGRTGAALAVFAVAGITDLLDGFVARFYRQQSVLGAYLDPLADKMLLTSAFITLSIPGLAAGEPIPLWVTVLVIARDVVIVVVAVAVYVAVGITDFPPSRISKWNTAFQVTGVFLVLIGGLVPAIGPLARATILVVALLTLASGIEYGYRFIYRANDLVARGRSG